MPSAVQTQTINSAGLMFKERSGETIVSAFTAVNARSSPPFPPKSTSVSGPSADGTHVRPYSIAPSEAVQDHKPLPGREWNSGPRAHESGHYSVSPSADARDRSPNSPPKRKRSGSDEDEPFFHSPEGAPEQIHRRFDPYSSSGSSPDSSRPLNMDQHSRTLPPIQHHGEHEKAWPSHENGSMVHHQSHYRESHDPHSSSTAHSNGMEYSQHQGERSSNTEITTRAGVTVDPKKRKRQFANRTKTGCGTCRKRKKKCDEAKPECQNCNRGGFQCAGYASKIPWPKDGRNKSHPPLQAKDQYALEPPQLFHSHGTSRESYPDATSSDGARTRPIVVEEHERRAPRGSWTWGDQPPPSQVPERPQTQEYSQPPPPPQSRPTLNPPSEQYSAGQGPPPHRQRIYHHTPQTMSQAIQNSPDVAPEPPVHHHVPPPLVHQGHQSHHQVSSTSLPAPPQHYTPAPPPRREKSEKERMLSGEAFHAYHHTLLSEREHCSSAVFRFNMTSNERVHITRDERYRHFQALVAAKWIPRTDMDMHQHGPSGHPAGYVGTEIYVETPFHCDYGYNLVIHDMVTIGPGCKFMDSGRITIGRNARIGANVLIDTQKVPTDSKTVKGSRGRVVAAEVSIGENVYIGANSTIAAGVKIGTGAIIQPGSVVIKDIPRDCVARGNPANVQSVIWDD